MLDCLSWISWIPVKVKLVSRLEPKGYRASNRCRALSKTSSPAQRPSSTWTPISPCTTPCSSTKENKQGSKGLSWKFNDSKHSLSSTYQRYGAFTRPYADFRSSQVSFSFNWSFSLSSFGGSTPNTRLSRRDPLRNAVFTSKLRIFQRRAAQYCNKRDLESRCNVGESFGISVILGSM